MAYIIAEPCIGVKDKACVEVCPTGVRQLVGEEMTVEEVMAEVLKDRVFYEESGGGVTISGGEPLSQPEFTLALLEASREAGVHSVLDTTGMGIGRCWMQSNNMPTPI